VDTAVSLAADGGFEPQSGVFGNIAARLRFPIWRLGIAASVTDYGAVVVRPLGTVDFALRLEPDVHIWLGVAVGGQLGDLNAAVALATLDIAVPLTRHVSFDVVVRAGGYFSPGFDRPNPLAQFGIGISWDSSPVSSPR
jgi:hypothetical protein